MFGLIKKLFGTQQTRALKKYQKLIVKINTQEELYQKLTSEELKEKTAEFKKRYQNGESLDNLLIEAYATVKNMCRRMVGTDVHVSGYDQKWDMIPYDVQLLGAIAMHNQAIAEMQTGEGKTLTAAMPLYLNALSGKPVHLVTVNDYLAKRDCEWIGSLFRHLGLSVASLTNDIHPSMRKEIYACDIVYGTASEFGFDYLRDNSMAMRKDHQCQRGHFFAIVDEIDSILIDEARTPLIISGPTSESKQMYEELKGDVAHLVKNQRELCSKLATEARKELEALGCFSEEPQKLSKAQVEQKQEAFKKIWVVSKAVPRHKILKRIRENPDLRAEMEKWEVYFHNDANKEEKQKYLSSLYIIVDEKGNEYELTDKGISACIEQGEGEQDFLMMDLGHEYALIDQDQSLSDTEKMDKKTALVKIDSHRKEKAHNLRQLFRAHLLMEKDVDYIIQNNAIVIIDENTGRPQPGRRFSDGLHQAIEAKESVKIQGETQTYATITLQNYFKMHDKIAGMTGTAITEANEFKEIYKLEVLQMPTNVPCIRADEDDQIYMSEREKYHAILKEILKVNGQGRPILIGTESVEVSEKLSRILKQNNLPHTVLNAKNHTTEAEIIAEAGNPKSITLATNMAGRGTDIKLKQNAKELGGLHVIGTTRHQSRRIDRQLRGRSGRQGDKGSSVFFVSFEDSLMRLFATPRMTSLLQRFRPPEGEPVSAKMLNKSIETAQKRVEQRNYTIRKHTLEYDDVMNKQRSELYTFRNEVLHAENPVEIAKDLIHEVCHSMAQQYGDKEFDKEGYRDFLMTHFPVSFELEELESNPEKVANFASEKVLEHFEKMVSFQNQVILQLHPEKSENNESKNVLNEIIRNLILSKVDLSWQKHLLQIDHLRSDVQLQTFAQKDPLLEFKQQAFYLFDLFTQDIRKEITSDLFRIQIALPEPKPLSKTKLSFNKDSSDEEKVISLLPKVGRNDVCHCGSGKKYKKCCAET